MNIFEGYPLEDQTYTSWEMKPADYDRIKADRKAKGWTEADWWNLDTTLASLLYNALLMSLKSEVGEADTFLSAKLLNSAAEDFQRSQGVEPQHVVAGAEYMNDTLLALQGYLAIRFEIAFIPELNDPQSEKRLRMVEAMAFVLSSLSTIARIYEGAKLSDEEIGEQRFTVGFAETDLASQDYLPRIFSELLHALRVEGNGYPASLTPAEWDAKMLRAEETVLAFGSPGIVASQREFADFLNQHVLSLWD